MVEIFEKIFETVYWKVELTNQQLYLGRCRVTLKRSCTDLADLSIEEMLDFLELIKKLESLLKETFDASMFNWTCLMNNAFQENNPEPQVHWHFRPRYKNPPRILEEIFEDPNFGHHYLHEPEKENIVNNETLKIIKYKLQQNLK